MKYIKLFQKTIEKGNQMFKMEIICLYFNTVKEYKIAIDQTYNCTIENCLQRFQNFSSFTRHILNHFKSCAQDDVCKPTHTFLKESEEWENVAEDLELNVPSASHQNFFSYKKRTKFFSFRR